MSVKRITAAVLAALTVLSGCGGAGGGVLSEYAPAEEARLIVYTSHKEWVYGPIVKEFEERTGVWVEVVTGGTEELLESIETHRDDPVCDVMFGGGVESLLSHADCFEPYTPAQADLIRPGLRQAGDVCTPFSSLPIVIIYNTRLVSPEQLTGWTDLLQPRWRGQIAFADPAVSGSSYTALVTMLTALGGDESANMRRFYDNLSGTVLSDSGDVSERVADGTMALGVTLEETALRRIAGGDRIGIVYPREGTSILPDGSALIAGAPHRDNAAAFLEFVQSTDVQKRVVSAFARRSVRLDVTDREDLVSEAGLTVVDYDVSRASANKESYLLQWAALGEEGEP